MKHSATTVLVIIRTLGPIPPNIKSFIEKIVRKPSCLTLQIFCEECSLNEISRLEGERPYCKARQLKKKNHGKEESIIVIRIIISTNDTPSVGLMTPGFNQLNGLTCTWLRN